MPTCKGYYAIAKKKTEKKTGNNLKINEENATIRKLAIQFKFESWKNTLSTLSQMPQNYIRLPFPSISCSLLYYCV